MLTIYIVFFDMEVDVPSAYVLDEDIAKDLIEGNDSADYIQIDGIQTDEWMMLLVKGHLN